MLPVTMTVLALTGLLGQTQTNEVQWQMDYRTAQKLAVEKRKPLAVFIVNRTAKGWKKLPVEVSQVLRTKYVPVVIDSDEAEGKKLAADFELSVGVIVSDRTGEKQALRIEGTLTPENLAGTLERLAKPEHVTTTTEIQGTQSIPTIQNLLVPTTSIPVCRT
jgi:hypothetical protein